MYATYSSAIKRSRSASGEEKRVVVKGGRKGRDMKLGRGKKGRTALVTDKECCDNNRALQAEKKNEKALAFDDVDLHLEANREASHTDDYELNSLIVRRGDKFTMDVTFDRNVSKKNDVIVLLFSCGTRSMESKGTLIRIPLDFENETTSATGWTQRMLEVSKKTVKVELKSPADTGIGKYAMYVETKMKDDKSDKCNRDKTDSCFYVLFNAWNEDDEVYMEDAAMREEYVLNQAGQIWYGTASDMRRRTWMFGQFANPVLEVTLDLLDSFEMGDGTMTSAVSIIRRLSALVNNNDNDGGILVGNWSGKYSDGTGPSKWTGSVRILKEFNDTGCPVKYGQCWVFSALSTTLLRALGIPTRSVTNFQSAHDNDGSMTIDTHISDSGTTYIDDTIWNYHVWNESWLKRNDLPAGYDGWQAHDATPQEKSDGTHRCGPASVRAIKMGHVYLNHDAGFIFAEVNGDQVFWKVDESNGNLKPLFIDKKAIGKNISTKAVGTNERLDITLEYKYKEGSDEEVNVTERVNRFSKNKAKNKLYKDMKPLSVKLEVNRQDNYVGDDLEITANAINTSEKDVNIRVRITLASTIYTGVAGTRVHDETMEAKLKGGETKRFTMRVPHEVYKPEMNQEMGFKTTATCYVLETNEWNAAKTTFILKAPLVVVKHEKLICHNKPTNVEFQITNTTNFDLHNGVFHAEGNSFKTIASAKFREDIKPGETASVEVLACCTKKGRREVIATFFCDEFDGTQDEGVFACLNEADFDRLTAYSRGDK